GRGREQPAAGGRMRDDKAQQLRRRAAQPVGIFPAVVLEVSAPPADGDVGILFLRGDVLVVPGGGTTESRAKALASGAAAGKRGGDGDLRGPGVSDVYAVAGVVPAVRRHAHHGASAVRDDGAAVAAHVRPPWRRGIA